MKWGLTKLRCLFLCMFLAREDPLIHTISKLELWIVLYFSIPLASSLCFLSLCGLMLMKYKNLWHWRSLESRAYSVTPLTYWYWTVTCSAMTQHLPSKLCASTLIRNCLPHWPLFSSLRNSTTLVAMTFMIASWEQHSRYIREILSLYNFYISQFLKLAPHCPYAHTISLFLF